MYVTLLCAVPEPTNPNVIEALEKLGQYLTNNLNRTARSTVGPYKFADGSVY